MNEEKCPKCDNKLKITRTPHTVHYGRLDCLNCGFVGWARNPNSPKNNTTQKLRVGKKSLYEVATFHGFIDGWKDEGKCFCFFCLRKKEELGKHETLTIDHIRELDKGGKDIIENMQILCSACHKLKNWCRLYCNWHFKKEAEDNAI